MNFTQEQRDFENELDFTISYQSIVDDYPRFEMLEHEEQLKLCALYRKMTLDDSSDYYDFLEPNELAHLAEKICESTGSELHDYREDLSLLIERAMIRNYGESVQQAIFDYCDSLAMSMHDAA